MFSIRSLAFGLVAVGVAACGGGQQSPNVAPTPSPEWVNRGSGAFNDSARAFYGVGVVAGIRNPGLARSTADNRARAEIATVLNVYVAQQIRDYASSTTDFDRSSEEQYVDQVIRSFSEIEVSGIQIINHWNDPNTNTLYALAKLDIAMATEALERVEVLNDAARDFIRQNAENAFDRLDRAVEQRNRN